MCVEFFRREVNVDQQKATIVEEQTRLQSDDSLWFQQRWLRLTASNYGKVARRRSTPVANLVKSLLYNKPVNTKGLRWGKDHEVHAESSYKQYLSRLNYQNIDVH